jgi:hypothetical protein
MTLGDTPTSTDSDPSTPRTPAWTPTNPNGPAFFPPTPRMSTGGSNPIPTAAGGANPDVPVMMSTAQLLQILQSISSQSNAATTTTTPNTRVGRTNNMGAWTGNGAQGLRTNPKGSLCMRSFKGNQLKVYQAMNVMEEKCKGGLQAKGAIVFGLPGETHFDKGALLLRELDKYMSNHGMEPVFQSVQSDGTIIDMLKQPGFLSTKLITSWIKDLTVDGVHDGQGGRRTICPYDVTNLQYSFHAVLKSCSALLRQDLLNNLLPSNHTGPQALMLLLTKVYPSSYTNVGFLVFR